MYHDRSYTPMYGHKTMGNMMPKPFELEVPHFQTISDPRYEWSFMSWNGGFAGDLT